MFGNLKFLIQSNAAVEMIYLSESGGFTHRVITIQEISDRHIKAFCHLRKQLRVFKIENVLSILPYKQRRKYIS